MNRTCCMVASLGWIFLAGCEEGALSFHYHDEHPAPPPPVVVVEHGHVCGPGCPHYWDGAHYVVVTRGHHHGPGCGHVLTEGRWVVAYAGPYGSAVVAKGGHPATPPARAIQIPPPPGPPEYYVYSRAGSKWQKIRAGHVHGPGCGHIYVEGHWCID